MKRDFELTLYTGNRHVHELRTRLPKIEVNQLLRGKSVADAAELLPSVFSLCAQAQRAAAWAALTSACAKELPADEAAARTTLVAIESVQETLRALLMCLPSGQQNTELMSDFARIWRDSMALLALLQKSIKESGSIKVHKFHQEAIIDMWETFCAQYVFGLSTDQWLTHQTDRFTALPHTPFLQWIAKIIQEAPSLGRIDLPPLPLERFCSGKLSWRALIASPYDAGTLRRVQDQPGMQWYLDNFGNSVAVRLIARLFDVAQTLQTLRQNLAPSNWLNAYEFVGNQGIATVECARGLLLHRAQVEDGRVVAYDICAPTDWNLNKNGALHTLRQLSATQPERLIRLANWLVQSLDPCVSFKVTIQKGEQNA